MWIAKVDLKDAFSTVSIYAHHKKYLKFVNQGIYYKFAAMPNGFDPAMGAFTEVLRPLLQYLEKMGNFQLYLWMIFIHKEILLMNTNKMFGLR